ncbi:unnamed protein product, partial [Choristocarpus tenellus]
VELIPLEDPGVTGRFEIILKNTNTLIHSKKQWGQGRCETSQEVDAVISHVRSFLELP